ncbi:M23 family metallopeptidase [Myceligenerans xiligouense]|uniref:Peptidase M23-like protein n=1 Tax=Myceligenerans xiligouense TaxID=253184 RepID=A0A3N4Z800_9MICO|nr:M23 family metallopeptidase [Myceligenerans xiligouense]RPF21452.1 peptidase M23-like protein [Myceligenerans xiligouense]
MRKLLPFLASPVLLLGPTVALLVLTIISAAARPGVCGPSVSNVPASLTATTADGVSMRLDRTQLSHAATIARVGAATDGIGRDGVIVALMAALTESRLRMLANTGAYPDSANYPNDGNGSDHDSLGLLQMRPAAGWGSVAELMDPEYQAKAFFGGPDGPNHGSPRGLLDVPGWDSLPKGVAAQSVEVSAYPDRYAAYEPVAETILDALTTPGSAAHATEPGTNLPTAENAVRQPAAGTEVVFPLPSRSWTRTSGFGYRFHPVYGTRLLHAGVDYAAPAGTAVLAAADGVVREVSWNPRSGNLLVLDHQLDDGPVSTAYAHLLDGSLLVSDGDPVTAGQQLASVGATGAATGPHLHFETHPQGFYNPEEPEAWLRTHAAGQLKKAAPAACVTGDPS